MMDWKIKKLQEAQKELAKAINASVSVIDLADGEMEGAAVLLASITLLKATTELIIEQAKTIDELNNKVDKLLADH